MDKEQILEEAQGIQDGVQNWVYNGKEYKVPIFGANAPDELCDLADNIGKNGDIEYDKWRDLKAFMFNFCKQLLEIHNQVTDEEIRNLATKKSVGELFNLWTDIGDSKKKGKD